MATVHKKLMVAADVHTLAMERINLAYDRYDHVAVSFSGGKDSTVCLNLAVEVARARGKLPVEAVCWDVEAYPPETVDYLARVASNPDVAMRWLCVPQPHRNACSKRQPYWYCWAPEDEHLWCRPLPDQAIVTFPGYPTDPTKRTTISTSNNFLFPDTTRTVGLIMGIRAAESLRRYRSVSFRTFENWISPDVLAPHVYLLKPIYDWATEDVWSAPRKFGWDYNRTYDVLQRAGVSRHDQRVCPPYGEEPLRGLWQYAECWPHLWDKMIARVPGAATAGRYCRSPMYGHKEISKPAGLTWQAAIRKELVKFPPDIRTSVAARLQEEIRKHNKKTGNAPIPDDGDAAQRLTWAYLYMIAVRGDLTLRKEAGTREQVAAVAGMRDLLVEGDRD